MELEEAARQLGYINLYDVFAGCKAFKRESEFWCWLANSFEYNDDMIKQNCFAREGQDEFIAQVCRLTPLVSCDLGATMQVFNMAHFKCPWQKQA